MSIFENCRKCVILALFGVLIGSWPQTAQAASQVLNDELSGRPNPATSFFDPTPVNGGPAGTFTFTAEFCNVGHMRLSFLTSVTIVLTGNNVLLNRIPRTPPGGGSGLTFPASRGLVDGRLRAGECVDVDYRIGLAVRAPFQFLVDVVGRSSDPTQPFTFKIDPNIQPSETTLPGLSGGPARPVGVVVGPDGEPDEFVVNELEFRPLSQDDLNAFLQQYDGAILRDSRVLMITEEGASLGGPAPFDNTYLIRVDLARSPLGDIERDMVAAGITGHFTFSSDDAARLAALLAREAGRDITLNIVGNIDCTICEHPDGSGGNLDAATFWWLTDDEDGSQAEDQGLSVGVIKAWDYLRYMGVPPLPPGGAFYAPTVAIIDQGFDLDPQTGVPRNGNIDYENSFGRPRQADVVDRDGTAGDVPDYTGGWHGQMTFGVAAAYPRNAFGSAGTGGEVVRPMLIRVDRTLATWADAVKSAIFSGVDVINMSLGVKCHRFCRDWGGGDTLQSNLGWARNQGIVPVVSAGNEGEDAERATSKISGVTVSAPKIPCVMNAVICVGAVERTGQRASVSNFGERVDIWAPTNFRSTVAPDSADDDADDVGEDELRLAGGTSTAAPFVAGIVGLMKALDQSFELADRVEQILRDTANTPAITMNTNADPLVIPGWVDAFRAVAAVKQNQPPTVEISLGLSPFPRSPSIRAAVHDPEPGGALPGAVVVRFSSDRDGELCVDRTSSTPFHHCNAPRLNPGTHVITATATDLFGGQGSASLTLSITNALPTATITSPSSDIRVLSSQFVNFKGQGFDADGPVSLIWRSMLGETRGTDAFVIRLPVGQHTVTLTVTDSDGATATDSVVVTVVREEGQPGIDLVPVRVVCTIPGNRHQLEITVANQGNIDAPASLTRVTFPSLRVATLQTPPIKAGHIIDLPPATFSLDPPRSGDFRANYIVTVDGTNLLNEANEGNNTASGQCPVIVE
jgi:serine protease